MSLLYKFASAFVFVAVGLSASMSLAEDRTVPAGRSSPIDLFATAAKNDCSTSGKPTTFISRKPAHGTISFQWVATTMDKVFGFCGSKPMKGMLTIYTPDKGFRGQDTATVGFRYPTYSGSNTTSSSSRTYNITVK